VEALVAAGVATADETAGAEPLELDATDNFDPTSAMSTMRKNNIAIEFRVLKLQILLFMSFPPSFPSLCSMECFNK
jgi:hypothetical protein